MVGRAPVRRAVREAVRSRRVRGPVMESAGTMTTNFDVLTALRCEWRTLSRSSASRRALDALRHRHGELLFATAHDFGDVVTRLEAHSGFSVEARARGVAVLLEEAADPFVRRALLQTLLPGIVSACRQLRFGEGIVARPSECVSEALAIASELLADWAGQRRPYAAPDFVSALRGRLRRWLLKEKAARRLVELDVPDAAGEEPSTLFARLDALRVDPTHGELAELVWQRVVAGVPLYQLAKAVHRSPATLQADLRSFTESHLL